MFNSDYLDSVTVYSCAVSSQYAHPLSSLDAFKRLLRNNHIAIAIDIRQADIISNEPQFNETNLRALFQSLEIQYHWAGRHFSNRFIPTEDGPDRTLTPKLRGFANYMRGDQFAMAYKHLLNLCRKSRCLLFSDQPLARCSRRLIADYLTLQGHQVIHLPNSRQHEEHLISAELRRESAQLIYDRKAVSV